MADRQPRIPAVENAQTDTRLLRFSFTHLDIGKPKFDPDLCCVDYFRRLMFTLKRFSAWTVSEFIYLHNDQEHRHIIDFQGSSEPTGFNIPVDPEQLGSHEPWPVWCLS